MRFILVGIFIVLSTASFSQKGATVFGVQYKPIIPNSLIGTYMQDFNEGPLVSNIKQKFGHSLGMVIRHGFTKNLSLETGINFNQRNYNLFYDMPDSSLSGENDVRIISYSIPLSGLIYIRLAEQFYMNASLGASMVLFPSDVQVFTNIEGVQNYFLMFSVILKTIICCTNKLSLKLLSINWRKEDYVWHWNGSHSKK